MWDRLSCDWLKAQLISIERKLNDQINTVIHNDVKSTQPFVNLKKKLKKVCIQQIIKVQ